MADGPVYRPPDLAAGTLAQYAETRDSCYLDNADADTLREMVKLMVDAVHAHREAWKGAGIHWTMNRELWAALGLPAPGDGGWVCPKDLSAMDADDPACLLCGFRRPSDG